MAQKEHIACYLNQDGMWLSISLIRLEKDTAVYPI